MSTILKKKEKLKKSGKVKKIVKIPWEKNRFCDGSEKN